MTATTTTLFDLAGLVAVVSGAARGIGRAMSLALAEHGADLLLVDRNAEGLAQTARDVHGLGRRAVTAVCDVSKPDEIVPLFARLDDEFGRIDFLANVAGEGLLAAPEEISIDELRTVLENLVVGRFCMCQEAGRRMLRARRGSIVNIGSLASVTALGRGHVAYSMAMGAVAQNDPRIEHRMGRLGRTRQRDLARAGRQSESRTADGGRPCHEERLAPWNSCRQAGAPGRYSRPGGAFGLGCIELDHRRVDSHGRRKPGFERGWVDSRSHTIDNVTFQCPRRLKRAMARHRSALPKMVENNYTQHSGMATQTVELNQILSLYRTMRLIRQCEEHLARCHQRGLIHGACHTYVGEEAIATGVCANLRADDVVFSTHRGHGHALAKGLPPESLIAELFGRSTGCSRGRGGSMHLFAPEIGLMGTSGIVGPCILQAVGAGYSFKIMKCDRVAVAFFGDGAVNNGAFHEGLNMASIWNLPVLFICENNQFATEVPFGYSSGIPDVGAARRTTACRASKSTAMTYWP